MTFLADKKDLRDLTEFLSGLAAPWLRENKSLNGSEDKVVFWEHYLLSQKASLSFKLFLKQKMSENPISA